MQLTKKPHLTICLAAIPPGRDAMKSISTLSSPLLLVLMLGQHQAFAESESAPPVFTGKVIGITDGDTVKVLRDNQTVKIRLSGIDAPEMDQPFGKQSKRFVSKLIFGKTVDVKDLGLDRYKRTLGYIPRKRESKDATSEDH